MAETTTFQETFKLDAAGAHRRQRTFALRAGAGASGRISWQPAPGLKGSSLYFNGVLVARGAKFLAGGSTEVALEAKNVVLTRLNGQAGAALTVEVSAADDADGQGAAYAGLFYQGLLTETVFRLPEIEVESDAALFAIPPDRKSTRL